MKMRWTNLAGGAAAAAVGAIAAVATLHGLHGVGSAPNDAATGAAVRAYLLDHPEVIPEAMEKLQDKQNAARIAQSRPAIETPFAGAVAGNPNGDVTLVEYFDYACGYCRASVADVDKLVASDPRVRVVFKELPILTPDSDRAARLSLAAAKAGKFLAYHHALYGEGALDGAKIDKTARAAGLDPAAAASGADIDHEIETNLTTARALRLSGTPTFVVGDTVLNGAVGYDTLKEAVAKARADRKA
ncbi:MAG TPA: DsbA family protein [Sphingomonas sp.]|nr:DsbA family protein [Sphingomonas sp.]